MLYYVIKQDTLEKHPKIYALNFFFLNFWPYLLALFLQAPASIRMFRWERILCPSTHPTVISVRVLSLGSVSRQEFSLSPLHWAMKVWKTRLGTADVSCKCWQVPWLHVPVADTPSPCQAASPSLGFWNNCFLPSHSFCLPALSLTLCLTTQAMLAIFTDSSHQPIWFLLPQTVTFIETSLQMSGLQTRGRSSPRGHSRGPWD